MGDYEEQCTKIRQFGGRGTYGSILERIVFTNGVFDILHNGHLNTLEYASSIAGNFGGCLVVGINSDSSTSNLKGSDRPIFSQEDRKRLLLSLRFVDHVIVFDEDTPEKLIRTLRPNIIVKGAEYRSKKVIGEDIALVAFAPMVPDVSTTRILERIR